MVNNDNFTLEEIGDIETFRSLRESWNGLLAESLDNNIFLTWEWVFTWWRYFNGNNKLKILVVKESGNIVGIAPLMQSKYGKGAFSVSMIENICAINGCDYSGIILNQKKPQALVAILGYLGNMVKNKNIIVRIANVPEYSGFLSYLREKYSSISRPWRLIERPMSSCPYINLPATWEDYLRPFPKKKRGHIKQKRNNIQKDYAVELVKNHGLDIKGQLNTLFELHRKRWRRSSIGKRFTDPKTLGFYSDVSETFHQNNWLDLSFLRVDGYPASCCWSLVYNGIFYYHTIAFDPSYSKYSAGSAHMLMLIEDAIQKGFRKFDMLKGAEQYKLVYAHGKTVCFQLLMAKPSIGGKYRLILLQILNKLNNIKSRSLRENFQLAIKRIKK